MKLDESLVNQQNYREFSPVEKYRIFRNVMREQNHILLVDNQKKQSRDSKTHPTSINTPYNSISSASGNSAVNGSNSGLNGMHTLTRKTSNTSLKRQSLSYKSNSSSRFKISGLFTKSRPFLCREIPVYQREWFLLKSYLIQKLSLNLLKTYFSYSFETDENFPSVSYGIVF